MTSTRKIYVVEDQGLVAQVIERLLLEQGYTVRLFDDGLDGYLETCLDPPDLLVADVLVPSLQGLAMARLIKFNEDLAHVPILVVSSITDGVEEGVRQVKADAFLPKPFEADVFLAEVARLLEASSAHETAGRAETPSLAGNAFAAAMEAGPSLPPLPPGMRRPVRLRPRPEHLAH